MTLVSYESNGLQLRSCPDGQNPHAAHKWDRPQDGLAHCWGLEENAPDAVEKYCTPGCICGYCTEMRAGLHPRTLMCSRRWDALTPEAQMEIHESISG